MFRQMVSLTVAVVVAAFLLAGCGAEQLADEFTQRATDRVEREAFCLQWRLVQKAGDAVGGSAAADRLRAEATQLTDSVPPGQRERLQQALDNAAQLADGAAGDLDEQAKASVEADLRTQLAELDRYCAGTLTEK